MENKKTSAFGASADATITATIATGAFEDISAGSTSPSKKTTKKMETAGASQKVFAGSSKMATLEDSVSSFPGDETGLLMSHYDLQEENFLRTSSLFM